jgi:hypothetical protein
MGVVLFLFYVGMERSVRESRRKRTSEDREER